MDIDDVINVTVTTISLIDSNSVQNPSPPPSPPSSHPNNENCTETALDRKELI